MLNKVWQPLFFIVIATASAIWHCLFIYALTDLFGQFNLVLLVLLFILFFFDFSSAVLVAIMSGFWLDILGFNFFGFYLIVLFVTSIFSEWLLANWLTNRSLYSFIVLIIISTLVYNLLVYGLQSFSSTEISGIVIFKKHFWISLGYQVAWSILAALFLFNFASSATRRLKPFFLSDK